MMMSRRGRERARSERGRGGVGPRTQATAAGIIYNIDARRSSGWAGAYLKPDTGSRRYAINFISNLIPGGFPKGHLFGARTARRRARDRI